MLNTSNASVAPLFFSDEITSIRASAAAADINRNGVSKPEQKRSDHGKNSNINWPEPPLPLATKNF